MKTSKPRLDKTSIYIVSGSPTIGQRIVYGPHYPFGSIIVARQYSTPEFRRRSSYSETKYRKWAHTKEPHATGDTWRIYRFIPRMAMEEFGRLGITPNALTREETFDLAGVLSGTVDMLCGKEPLAHWSPAPLAFHQREEWRKSLRVLVEDVLMGTNWRYNDVSKEWKRRK